MRGRKVPKRHKRASAKDIAEVLSGKLKIQTVKVPKKARDLIRRVLTFGECTEEAAARALMYELKIPVGNAGSIVISLYNGGFDSANGVKLAPLLEIAFFDKDTPQCWKSLEFLPDYIEFFPRETAHSIAYRIVFED
jgi:hypothetical protein